MQLLIDTETESLDGLMISADTLLAFINAASPDYHYSVVKTPHEPAKPAATSSVSFAAPAPAAKAPPPPVVDVPAGTAVDPAAAFARPLVPAPPAAIATAAATSTVPPTLAPVIAPPPAPAAVIAAAPDAADSSQTTTAPSASATAQAPASAAAERDGAGYPWDARVHSETRKLNADGTWRYRRNLDANVKAVVMAELKARLPGAQVSLPAVGGGGSTVTGVIAAPPPPAAVGAVAPPPPADVAPPPPVTPQPPVNAVAPPAPVQLPVQANVGLPVAGNTGALPVTSFRDLMLKVNQALAAGRITQPQLAEACKAAGADGVSALAAQPMLVPAVDAYLNRWLA